jgi:hypothetical protein
VDLSAIIFVVLALAWAVYLIPKALKHHDEMASDRLVEGHSDKVRILSRHGKVAKVEAMVEAMAEADVEAEAAVDVEVEVEPATEKPARDKGVRTMRPGRKAAQRRRRVLGLLVLALAVVWTLTWFAYLPIWAPAIPGAMVLVFLVVARLSVRRMQRRRRRTVVEQVETATFVEADEATYATAERSADTTVDLIERLADEDTIGVPRQQIEAALADDGSLWDPLPLTLPTYVNKARARRTVRTIELTGINSSGHDRADTTLARESDEAAQAPAETEGGQRRVAGA